MKLSLCQSARPTVPPEVLVASLVPNSAAEPVSVRRRLYLLRNDPLDAAFADMAKSLQHQMIARALQLIEQEANWSRGDWARTSTDKPCAWSQPDAAKFCATAALNRAALELAPQSWYDLAASAQRQVLAANSVSDKHLPEINDMEGHAVIVAMFKRALA